MNLLEFAVLVLILLVALRGYFRGFFRELCGLAAWLGGGLASYLLGPIYGPTVSERFQLPVAIGQMLAGFAIFCAFYLTCQIVGWILHRLARAIFLGPVDRAAGFVLGGVKAIAIVTLFCMLVTSRRGLPQFSERVQESEALTRLAAEGWNVFAIAREKASEYADLKSGWQRPYSKMELEAREALNRFLTPKPSTAPPPSATRAENSTEKPK